jgi:UDP:flavonoid glycosyltransferase YjiC (YdhE family)
VLSWRSKSPRSGRAYGRIVKTQIRAGGARSVNTTPAPAITRGIEDVLGDVAYRDRARAIAAKMAATPTVDEVRTRLTSRRR